LFTARKYGGIKYSVYREINLNAGKIISALILASKGQKMIWSEMPTDS